MREVGYGLSPEGASAADPSNQCAPSIEPAAVSPHLLIRQVTFAPMRKGKSHEHPGRRFFGSVT